jgi:hypothetical protein
MAKVKWERGTMLSNPRAANHARAFGVYAVDPGGTSGWARGVFKSRGTLADTLKNHAVEAGEFVGTTLDQSFELTNHFLEWREECLKRGVREVILVFESFELRTQRTVLASVEVIHGARCLLASEGVEIDSDHFQSPSQAKSFGTAARLKYWGLYPVGRGSDHKRDALRHLALAVSRRMDGRLGA